MRIIIFGCGDIYNKRKKEIPDDIEIVGIIDNNRNLQGRSIDGILVYMPHEAEHIDYDYIVLMSDAAVDMRKQMLELGYNSEKLIHYADFFGLFPQNLYKYDVIAGEEKTGKKTLLIISVFWRLVECRS